MSRLFHSPNFRSLRHFMLALMLLAITGLFITSHTHGNSTGVVSNTPTPASYFDASLYTPEQLSFSSINDGIPDVWKDYYGFNLSDPELATGDYNGMGVTNLVKYHANLWPLDTGPPQPLALLPKPTAKPVTAKAPAASVSRTPLFPSQPILANGTFSEAATLGHTSNDGYGGTRFQWGYNTSINGWKALHGSQIEVWSVNGNQFVELDASKGNYGIKQQVTNVNPGTYLLTWKHRGRDSARAGNNSYRAFVYTEISVGLSRVTLKEVHFPVPPQVVSKTAWETQALAFTVREADLVAPGVLKKSLWIAFEPDGNNTYGTLIDDVSLAPMEFKVVPDSWKPVFTAPSVTYHRDEQGEIDRVDIGDVPNGYSVKIDVKVKVHVPSLTGQAADNVAKEWDLFLFQNIVRQGKTEVQYKIGNLEKTVLKPVPGQDSNGFGKDPGDIPKVIPFSKNDEELAISLEDSPGFIKPRWKLNNPGTQNPITSAFFDSEFITWLVARHRDTGAKVFLKWIKWEAVLDVDFDFTKNPPDTKRAWRVRKLGEGDGQGAVAPVVTPSEPVPQP